VVLSLHEVALAGGEDDGLLILFDGGLVEENAAAVPTCVFGVVESFVGTGEERGGDFA
jgi:hypothetical protein